MTVARRAASLPRAADGLVYAPNGGVYDPDGVLAYAPANTRPRPQRTIELSTVANALDERGLRPIIDRQLRIVLVDCPDCRGQDSDPLGLWRPLRVVPRPGAVSYICDGCQTEMVRRV